MFTDFTEELNSYFVQQIENLNQFRSLDFYYIIEAYGNENKNNQHLNATTQKCWGACYADIFGVPKVLSEGSSVVKFPPFG